MIEVSKIVSSFGDVVQTFKKVNKYVVRINEKAVSEGWF